MRARGDCEQTRINQLWALEPQRAEVGRLYEVGGAHSKWT